MSTFTSRLYFDNTDLVRLIEFLPVARPADRVGDYPGVTDLREMLCQPDLQANTCLWFDQQDQLIAFALVDAFHNLLFDYDHRANSNELEEAIVQWGVMCLRRAPQEDGEAVTLDAVTLASGTVLQIGGPGTMFNSTITNHTAASLADVRVVTRYVDETSRQATRWRRPGSWRAGPT